MRHFTPLRIVCSDRDQHERIPLVGVQVWPDGKVLIELEAVRNRSRAHVTVPRTDGPVSVADLNNADAWEFWCPQCRRTPRVRKAVLVAAARNEMPEFDVSQMGG